VDRPRRLHGYGFLADTACRSGCHRRRSDISVTIKIEHRVALALGSLLCFLALGDASGLVIEHEADALNLKAPADDPGWANVGVCSAWTCVYLGRGWVITAAHVGASRISLDGTVYAALARSAERVFNPDGTAADLVLFRIHPEPVLPSLEIAAESPPIGTQIVMIGSGLGRGEKTLGLGRAGFLWQAPSVKRWGTGLVSDYRHDLTVGFTDTFAVRFSIAKTANEAIAARGDSGGAAFAYLEGRWQLVGIILAVDNYPGQPEKSSAYGNRTFIADLARYRESIVGIMDAPTEADENGGEATESDR